MTRWGRRRRRRRVFCFRFVSLKGFFGARVQLGKKI